MSFADVLKSFRSIVDKVIEEHDRDPRRARPVLVQLRRTIQERIDAEEEKTPVAVPTSKSSSGFKAVVVSDIFDQARDGGPNKHEP